MQLPESVLGELAILGTVLIVDDDARVRHTARLALAREECGILTASDGHTAIEFMSMGEVASKVCALLCDLEMPQMSLRKDKLWRWSQTDSPFFPPVAGAVH